MQMKTLVNISGGFQELENEITTPVENDIQISSCNGNACSSASVSWNGNGYNINNSHSNRKVRVRIRFLSGLQCLDWSDIDLDPGQTKRYGNGGYCNPYEANFL